MCPYSTKSRLPPWRIMPSPAGTRRLWEAPRHRSMSRKAIVSVRAPAGPLLVVQRDSGDEVAESPLAPGGKRFYDSTALRARSLTIGNARAASAKRAAWRAVNKSRLP